MTEQIREAMKARIEQLDWMSPATKTRALEKLAAMRNKVGYPDVWRDYSALDIVSVDFFGNVARARSSSRIVRPPRSASPSIAASGT